MKHSWHLITGWHSKNWIWAARPMKVSSVPQLSVTSVTSKQKKRSSVPMQSGFQIILLSQNLFKKNSRSWEQMMNSEVTWKSKKNFGRKKIRWQGAGIWKFTSNLKTLSGFTLVSQSLRPLEDFNPRQEDFVSFKKNDEFPNFPS